MSLTFCTIVFLSDLVAGQIVTCVLFSDSMVLISNLLGSVGLVVCLSEYFLSKFPLCSICSQCGNGVVENPPLPID
jgi:hypothetical protein